MDKRIVLTGGGTAGHIMPNLALIPYLKNQFDEIHYIGSEGGMEENILKKYKDVKFHAIRCAKLRRSLTLKNLCIPFLLVNSVFAAKKLLKEIKPDIIFSKGGYAALPVSLAADEIPLILHESDIEMGLANKIAAHKCAKILTSFDISGKNFVHTGAPIRKEIYFGDKSEALRECGLNAPLPFLLITGGSQGAAAINGTVIKALDGLCRHFNVVHLTGKNNLTGIKHNNYYENGFTDKMPSYLALADYAVTRGGANTLFELAALKKPSLIIPLPKDESRGDQIKNAEYFESKGYSLVLPQSELNENSLLNAVLNLKAERIKFINAMSSASNIDGTVKIYKIIAETALQNSD